MRIYPLQQGKNISVFLNSDITSVRDMILEHYDDKEPPKTLVFNWPFYEWWDIKEPSFELKRSSINEALYDLKDLKKNYNKLILLETEHLPFWVMSYMNEEWLEDIDEIWVMWLEALEFFKHSCTGVRDKVRWVPMRYCSRIEHIGTSFDCHHNLGFFGQMSPERKKYWDHVENVDWSSYHINGLHPREVEDLTFHTKFILDMPFRPDTETLSSQNVVRIFEMICMGKHVLTFPSTFNYFEGLVTEMEDPMEDIKSLKWQYPLDFRQKYKDLTYKDEDFHDYMVECILRYNQKYGDPYNKDTILDGIWKVNNPIYGKI